KKGPGSIHCQLYIQSGLERGSPQKFSLAPFSGPMYTMRIVITGAAGFLGSRLARSILERGKLTDARGETRDVRELVLLDVVPAQLSDPRVRVGTCDLGDPPLASSVAAADAAST